MNVTQKTQAVCKGLNAIGENVWHHDYQDVIHTTTGNAGDVDITFGHANETWGASVDFNGVHLDYLETGLVFTTESIERLVYVTQRVTDAYISEFRGE